ncbi:hypothetical protein [Blastococcus sp. Marseille-P5729]|uniref:hypothetical protein n=1 Tax=Blastococcus sp. Marseille-P5729 TaxID=2086582 RepID=UPI000D10F7B7|nr:hypothetical protein [Blastococcus sp. Marseille-P5729]
MSAKNKLLDPLAGALGAAAGVGSFFLIPGLAAAIPAAIGIGAIVYGAKVAASSFADKGATGAPKPSVGAGSEHSAPARLKRGSRAEVWHGRGHKAVRGMQDIVAGTQQEVIKGQLENVALEARDSLSVLDQLAGQIAAVERSLDQMPAASLRDQRDRLTDAVATPGAPETLTAEHQRALDSVIEQQRTVSRLQEVRTGLLGRMEAIVLGLERLQADMNETVATGITSGGVVDPGGEHQLRDLSDQLAGLRAGLEESKRYTAEVLGPNA